MDIGSLFGSLGSALGGMLGTTLGGPAGTAAGTGIGGMLGKLAGSFCQSLISKGSEGGSGKGSTTTSTGSTDAASAGENMSSAVPPAPGTSGDGSYAGATGGGSAAYAYPSQSSSPSQGSPAQSSKAGSGVSPIQSAISGVIGSLNGGGLLKLASGKNDPSQAGTAPGTVDHALAQKNAQKIISQIDWSKDRIGLWAPGTGSHVVNQQFANGLGGDTSTVALDYPSNLDMYNGVATGMETARLVLEETAKRGKTVVMGGHSQGSWLVGEVMANPEMRSKVDKAVLYGHPSPANAQYEDGRDPKVREINNADDPYANQIDLAKVGAYLAGARRADGSDPHGYNYASESAWLLQPGQSAQQQALQMAA